MADYEPRHMIRCEQDHLVVLDVGTDTHELRGCPVCGAPCVFADGAGCGPPGDVAARPARHATVFRGGLEPGRGNLAGCSLTGARSAALR
jgi:hypothetical protein